NARFFPSAVSDDSEAQETRSLLNRLAEGDREAFWPLWEQHKKHLYTICLNQMKGMHNDAEDALSEAMLKALNQLPRYACDIENCKAWLTRMTYNLCKDVHKRSKKLVVEEIRDEIKSQPFHANRDGESPEDAILRREVEKYILHAVNNLPAALRDLFILRAIQERTYPELAERFAISVENARKRMQKARGMLQKEIALYFSGGNPPIPENTWRDEIASLAPSAAPRLEEMGEIKVDTNVTRMLPITLASGEAKVIHLFLPRIPARPQTRLKTLCEYIERHPRGWKKRLERASLLYAVGRWDEAIREYKEVLRIQPRSTSVRAQLGNTLHLMGRDEEAVSVYTLALKSARSEAARLHLGGMIAVCLGRYREAIEIFREAARAEPRNTIHWLQAGMTCLLVGNAARAIEAFDAVLNINPDDILALTESYVALRAVGRDEEASERVKQMLRVCPGDVLAIKRMADHSCRPGSVREEKMRQIAWDMRIAPIEAMDSTVWHHVSRGECDRRLSFPARLNERHLNGGQKSDSIVLLRDRESAINAFRQNPFLYEREAFSYQSAYEIVTS
ncbi:MAG: sigma-70 family RNA polymerase sigma factor, partial [Acidobacteriota bacterium]